MPLRSLFVSTPPFRAALARAFFAIILIPAAFAAADDAAPVPPAQTGNAFEQYVNAPDSSFAWKRAGDKDGFVEIELTSQTWRGIPWRHHLWVFGEPDVLPSAPAALFITGGNEKPEDLAYLKKVAGRAHVVTALLTNVPNQPLFDGKKEDGLLAYTFDQYSKTGDPTWPVIFPMVKSVMRAMDAMTEFTHGGVKKFLLSGASKRGWTAYLTAAVDGRVAGIAPRVFEMVHIQAQTEWEQKVYGAQSEKLQDFTELGLINRLSTEPRLEQLRKWIDPYEYRSRLTMPKLIVLGTNDRYWVVDSQRWYWNELPEPKALVQNPNLGHHLGDAALDAVASWIEYLASGAEFPSLSWEVAAVGKGYEYRVKSSAAAKSAQLWKACAVTRDMREAPWSSEKVDIAPGNLVIAGLESPKLGHCAYFVEEQFSAPSGKNFALSTEAVVFPELPDAPVIGDGKGKKRKAGK